MLAALTPLILGIVTQIASAVGSQWTTPRVVQHDPANRREHEAEFALDVDTAQLLPSAVTVLAAALVIPGIALELRSVGAVAAVVGTVAVMIMFQRLSPNDYDSKTRLWFTPLNQVLIAIYVLAALVVVAVGLL